MATIHLYVKQHNITGLKYFGMTTRKDPLKYSGSGLYWSSHLRKHGRNVNTVEVWKFDNQTDASNFAISFSEDNDIVASKEWANMIVENAAGGLPKGFKHTQESKTKMSESTKGNQHHKGHRHSRETRQHMSSLKRGIPLSEAHKTKISEALRAYYTDEMRAAQSIKQRERGQSKGPSNPQFGKCWMTNGLDSICAKPEEIQALVENGYRRGRIINKSL